MANPKKSNVLAVLMRVAYLFWDETHNFAREKASSKRAQLPNLLKDGWNQMLGSIPAEEIDVASNRDNVDYVQKCLDLRTAQWEALKADKSADSAIKLTVFEEMFLEHGKLIKPTHLPNACFQRGLTFFDAMVLRRKEGEGILDSVPVIIRSYDNEGERLREQVSENEQKTLGAEPLSDRDRIRTAKRFYDLAYNQTFLRRLYTDTTGQKLWGFCRVDQLFPNVHILDRVLKPVDAEDSIPYGPVTVNDLNSFIRRADKTTCKAGETVTTQDEVAKYFSDVKANKTNREPIMKRDSIVGLSEQSPIQIVRDTAKAVLTNNLDSMAKYIPIAAGLNVLVELAAMGEYPAVELELVNKLQSLKLKRSTQQIAQSA